MASLREIKDRIGSVRSTLKITGAMKLVASAKLRKAQQAVQALRPYEATLSAILSSASTAVPGIGSSPATHGAASPVTPGATSPVNPVSTSPVTPGAASPGTPGAASPVTPGSDRESPGVDLQKRPKTQEAQGFEPGVQAFSAKNDSSPMPFAGVGMPDRVGRGASGCSAAWPDDAPERIAVVAVASNSSLCGSFNGNVLRRTLELLRELGANSAGDVSAPSGSPHHSAGRDAASDPVRSSAAHPSAGDVSAPSGVRPSDSPHHPSGAVPPLSDRGCHVPQGQHLPGQVAVDLFPIGRRIADPLRKLGYPAATLKMPDQVGHDAGTLGHDAGRRTAPAPVIAGSDRQSPAQSLNDLVAHPSYEAASALATALAEAYNAGVYSRIILVYNHFVTTSKQEVLCETWLPFTLGESLDEASRQKTPKMSVTPGSDQGLPSKSAKNDGIPYILEPSAQDIISTLLPQVLRLKIYAMILDSIAAEHAARMIAMQTATDNAQEILDELTLEYNKGRQQQITAEILDIVGGSRQ